MNSKYLKLIQVNGIWFILLLGIVLRFWGLGSTPPSLYWDEVSQGFNSYSILKTGHDEHKELLPLARFQAFGDYKAPVYIYLDVLPILIFGQTEFAVRFPSALLGSLTILVAYFLALEIFWDNKRRKNIALMSSFLLAISPWHIQLSRAAYEANAATFFTVTGVFFFLLAKRKNLNFLFISVICFVLAFYSFNAHRIFIPLMFVLLIVLFGKSLVQNIKKLIIILGFGLILLLPFILYFQTPESRLRFQEVNIFSDISVVEESNRLSEIDDNSTIGKIIHNRRVHYALSYIRHYFDFYNPSYLFFTGDVNPRFSTRDIGQLYLFTLPFIIIGMITLSYSEGKSKLLLFGWLLLSPLAAATARETPHALRSETFIPLFEFFAAFGFVIFYDNVQKYRRIKVFTWLLLGIISTYYLAQFLHSYFVHMPQKYSQDWQYGYKQTISKVENLKDKYDKIVFSDIYGRAYVYVLWYGKYLPVDYWENGDAQKDRFGFYNVKSFGKYVFQSPNSYEANDERILYVGLSSELPTGVRVIDRVNFLDNTEAFVIADNQK